MKRRNFKKPVVRRDPVTEAGKRMIDRMNGGKEFAGIPSGDPPGKFIERLVRGGKVSSNASNAKETNAFLDALTNAKPAKTVKRSTGSLMDKAKAKKGKPVVSDELNESLMDTVFDKETSIRPKKGKGKHRGQTLQQDEHSLLDGMSEEGFIGPQEPQL